MGLQFTHVRSFACRGRLRNLLADCSTVGPSCVTIKWPQIFKDSLQVTVVGVFPHVTVERRHLDRSGLPDGAKFGKNHCFQKNLSTFAIFFMRKFCHYLKYQLSVLTKQSILDYIWNKYSKLREKYNPNLTVVNYHSDHPPTSAKHSSSVFYSKTSVQLSKTKYWNAWKNMDCKNH